MSEEYVASLETFAQIEGVTFPQFIPINTPDNGHVFAFPDDAGFIQDGLICYVDDSIDIESFAH
jgi:hypothetical protein